VSDFSTTIMKDLEIDGEKNWHYYHERDEQWDHLVDCWHVTKEPYLRHIKNYTKNVMVCAGGHVGIYARFYMRLFKTVYVFEPDPQSFVCLVNNTSNSNVVKIQAALGSKNQLISLHGPAKMALYAIDDSDGFIPTFTIDSLNLNSCDAIQLDIENAEYDALIGAEQTINKFRPTIILENGETQKILELMASKDYVIAERIQHDTIWIPKE